MLVIGFVSLRIIANAASAALIKSQTGGVLNAPQCRSLPCLILEGSIIQASTRRGGAHLRPCAGKFFFFFKKFRLKTNLAALCRVKVLRNMGYRQCSWGYLMVH